MMDNAGKERREIRDASTRNLSRDSFSCELIGNQIHLPRLLQAAWSTRAEAETEKTSGILSNGMYASVINE